MIVAKDNTESPLRIYGPGSNLADHRLLEITEADRLGMAVIVGFFYFGSNERIQIAPDDRYVREAIVQGCRFLKGLPHRNILIEINNETNASSYKHRILQPNGALDAVLLAQQTVERQIPVSMSWSGGIMPRGSRGEAAMRAVDYVMFHTNGQTPEEVHQSIQGMRRWLGYDRPLIINEDGVSTLNLHAAVQEHVGWGYYDNSLTNYRDGFQAPPVNWKINTPVKWQFFEQVARLTGSPIPPKPEYSAADAPEIEVFGLKPGQVLRERAWIEAIVKDRHPRWPIDLVELPVGASRQIYRAHAAATEQPVYPIGTEALPGPRQLIPGVVSGSGVLARGWGWRAEFAMPPVRGQKGAHLVVNRRIESGLRSEPRFTLGFGLLQRGMK